MLSDSYESFVKSRLFLGGPAYGKNSNKIKPWYNYLYVAQFEGRFDKVKIGITTKISRRNDELNRENEGANIKYAWSMPTNLEVETRIKILLSNFTKKFSSKRLRTETFYVPVTPFILFVRLVILYVYLEGGYISGGNDPVKKKLEDYLNRARIEYIKFNDVYYRQRNNTPRMKAIVRAQKLIDDIMDMQRRIKFRGEKISFAEVNEKYYTDDIIRQLRDITKAKGSIPSTNTQRKEFIDEFIEKYVENGEMNEDFLKFMPKEGQERDEFKVGDMVTVTYPPYRPADKETGKQGGRSALGDPDYPEGGSWQGRITKKQGAKYRVKWAFGKFKETDTLVDPKLIHHDGDVKRGVDLTEIYKDLKLPNAIDFGEYDDLKRKDDELPKEVQLFTDAMDLIETQESSPTQERSPVKLKM